MSEGEEEIKQALKEVLKIYNIEFDESEFEEEEEIGDYSKIINKTQQRLDELNEKAEEIYRRTGMSKEEIARYAENPNNFTQEQWEALQKVKEACEKYKREARHIVGEDKLENTPKRKNGKKQRGRFAKKKHWIPL